MQPLISLVVPYHNHPEGLPRLLKSIAAQSLKDIEVVVVDDCSDRPCRDIVAAHVSGGMNIRLLECAERRFTKNARLIGIEAATAPVVGFADADDALWGTEELERHVRLMLNEEADLLHFNLLHLGVSEQESKAYAWAAPFAPALEGGAVFAAYVNGRLRAHNLVNKYVSRSLCLAMLPAAKESGVKRYMEDLALNTLFFFHSRRYRGSEGIGYACKPRDSARIKAPGRAVALSLLLREFVPYIVRQGSDLDVARACSDELQRKLQRWVGTTYAHAREAEAAGPGRIFEEVMEDLLEHGSESSVLKAFLGGHPIMGQARMDRADKERTSQRLKTLAALGKPFAARLKTLPAQWKAFSPFGSLFTSGRR